MSSVLAKELAERIRKLSIQYLEGMLFVEDGDSIVPTLNQALSNSISELSLPDDPNAQGTRGFLVPLAALIDSALPKSEWVSVRVEIDLPPDNQEVWVVAVKFGGERIVMTAYRNDGWWYWDTEDGRVSLSNYFKEVTHWQKKIVPAAPSTDEKEESRD